MKKKRNLVERQAEKKGREREIESKKERENVA